MKCGATGKEIFETKDLARAGLNAHARGLGSTKEYRCPFCNYWHLTKNARGNRRKKR